MEKNGVMEIGKRLEQARGNRTAGEVCSAAGITENALSAYETGIRIPRDEVKYRLAAIYGKTVAELFF